jgi:DNA-binding IclR family transcriptional regulator
MDRTVEKPEGASGAPTPERARPSPGKPDRAMVQSVAVAAKVLKTLAAEGGALPLKKLSLAAGMPRAKVHRYLASLRSAGLVTQDPESGEYRIGPGAVTIGLVGLGRMSPVRQLVEALPRLRDRINETVTAAIWGETGPTVIAMEESDRVVTMNVRIGTVLPLSTTAIGRLFLAFLPQAVTHRFLVAERRGTSGKLPSDRQLAQLLASIRSEQISVSFGALMPGVDAMAVPVFDYRGQLVAAICAVGRFEGANPRSDSQLRQSLAAAGAELSKQLGYIEPR